ncbi:DNA-binding protein, partial [Candidatus Atribacteria bacterium 1244-E10-H5-B2]
MENGNEYLNSTDIARILGLTRRTVVTIMNDGQIKYSRVGVRSKRVDPIDLIIYLENMGNDRRAMAGF